MIKSMRKEIVISEKGAALSEFSLMIPILSTILLWSMFFTDLSVTRMKMLEMTRFLAFGMASKQITDPVGNTASANTANAWNAVVADAEERFEFLESGHSKLTEIHGYTFKQSNTSFDYSSDPPKVSNSGALSNRQILGTNDNPDIDKARSNTGASGKILNTFSSVMSFFDRPIMGIYNYFDFNTNGRIEVSASVGLENTIIPKAFLDGFFGQEMIRSSNEEIVLTETMEIYIDHWNLFDGSPVSPEDYVQGSLGGFVSSNEHPHPLWKKTNKMFYIKLMDNNFMDTARTVLNTVSGIVGDFPQIMEHSVTSLPFDDSKGQVDLNDVLKSANNNNALCSIFGGVFCSPSRMDGPNIWDTSPYRDLQNSSGTSKCPNPGTDTPGGTEYVDTCAGYYSTWLNRGGNYMGCPKDQENCTYRKISGQQNP